MKDIKELEKAEIEAIQPAEFGINDAKELKRLLTRFMKEYAKKPAELSDQEWLKGRFMAELPAMSEEEAEQLSQDTVSSVQEYNSNLASLHQARAQGKTGDEWFAEKAQEASAGVAALDFAEKLDALDEVITEANNEMLGTIFTKSGEISHNRFLYGYMAEQQHVNTFNAAAAASESSYTASVCAPAPGSTYGKNSFDIVIKDRQGHIVHQYQSKFGIDAEHTINLIRRGNYNNQTLLVPEEQVEAVQAAFPGKTVVSKIGGTDKVPVESKSMTLTDAQKLQEEAYTAVDWPKLDWKTYDTKTLAKFVGKKAAVAGVQGAALATGFHLAAKLIRDEPVDGEEVVKVALQTGADAGVKSAAAGALTVAGRKGILSFGKKWHPNCYTAIACVAVENVKILWRVGKGEITMRESLDLMGCNTVAMTHGLAWGATGSGIGILALGWIPVVGPFVGGVVGGLVGYMAGSKVGEAVYDAAKSIVSTAKKAVKNVFEGGKKLLEKAGNFLSNLFA